MKKFWSELPGLVQAIIIIVSLIILYLVGRRIYTYIKNKQLETVLATSTVAGINLGSVAQRIYAAFHEYSYGLAEDEEAAIIALLDVPKALVPQLSSIYFTLYSKNLNNEFTQYLSTSDYARIQAQFS